MEQVAISAGIFRSGLSTADSSLERRPQEERIRGFEVTMEKTSHSSEATSASSICSSVQSSLRSLNKASYKISKVQCRNPDPSPHISAARIAAATPQPEAAESSGSGAPPYQPQPPVYNIDKNDFRSVVQKLTGSPAHHQIRDPLAEQQPPPPPPPRPSPPPPAAALSSRLHRIRPPPLADLSYRPPPPSLPGPPAPPMDPWTRPPLSPLPPLPAVSAAVESPISAYMRHLRGGGLPGLAPMTAGYGCLLSPPAYQMMMAATGMGLPTSPGVQLPSPRLGDP